MSAYSANASKETDSLGMVIVTKDRAARETPLLS
jgi:hypothetical protein